MGTDDGQEFCKRKVHGLQENIAGVQEVRPLQADTHSWYHALISKCT